MACLVFRQNCCVPSSAFFIDEQCFLSWCSSPEQCRWAAVCAVSDGERLSSGCSNVVPSAGGGTACCLPILLLCLLNLIIKVQRYPWRWRNYCCCCKTNGWEISIRERKLSYLFYCYIKCPCFGRSEKRLIFSTVYFGLSISTVFEKGVKMHKLILFILRTTKTSNFGVVKFYRVFCIIHQRC